MFLVTRKGKKRQHMSNNVCMEKYWGTNRLGSRGDTEQKRDRASFLQR